jgi:hypothetical protein
MKKTENYNLNLPELNDNYSVDDSNNNMSIIDATLKGYSDDLNEVKENTKIETITYSLYENEIYKWQVVYPNMFVKDGIAYVNFRLESSSNEFNSGIWRKVLQLSVKPKSLAYGVVNTVMTDNTVFSAYIDSDGAILINPKVTVTASIRLDIAFVFIVK